ncbi:MAG: STAS domain-containing protein [Saccharothrix sp.]|nr:STAS domain-containing protein [Saccharothrix sp.]
MTSRDGSLSITTTTVGDVSVIRLVGEIDMTNAEAVHAELLGCLERTSAGVVVDLTDVTFLASSGLSALVAARSEAERRGVGLAVAAAGRAVLRPLEATRVDTMLLIHATTADAVTALRTGSST